jgi:hypothetical protein
VIDKSEVMVPYSTNFRPQFQFIQRELRYAGVSSQVIRSKHYLGSCDLRPFGFDAIVHIHYRRKGPKNHKLEILHAGEKSIDEIGAIIEAVFDVDPMGLRNMRIDFAADMYGIPVLALHRMLRMKFKQSFNELGDQDYELIGGRRLEYCRLGKSPNCLRVYDKPAECAARLPGILKQMNQDGDPLTFEEVFGFPENTVMSRIERQAGGGRIPEELATFGQLYHAAEYDPFSNLEIVAGKFVIPDPKVVGEARSLKLAGISLYIQTFGYQQTRAMLNSDGNAKRHLDDYQDYLRETEAITSLTIETIVESYQTSVSKQISGTLRRRLNIDVEISGQRTAFQSSS